MSALRMAVAWDWVIVPLATSDSSGPWPGTQDVLEAATVLAAADGTPAVARAVAPPPPARRPAAARPARPASSFLFMASPAQVIFRSSFHDSGSAAGALRAQTTCIRWPLFRGLPGRAGSVAAAGGGSGCCDFRGGGSACGRFRCGESPWGGIPTGGSAASPRDDESYQQGAR